MGAALIELAEAGHAPREQRGERRIAQVDRGAVVGRHRHHTGTGVFVFTRGDCHHDQTSAAV